MLQRFEGCDDLSSELEENGVLYLTIGYIATQQGPGWFDQAVIFCPFCGRKIQDKDEIARSSQKS